MAKRVGIFGKPVIKAVICTAASFVFLLFSVLCGGIVFGWFYDNRNAAVGGMDAVLNADDYKVRYYVYAYDLFSGQTESASEYYTVYNPDSGENITAIYNLNNLKMNPYDMIFVHRNDYTPVVVRISITGEHTLPKSGSITVNLSRDKSKDESSLNYFSSVVKFACIKGAEILAGTVSETYDNVAEIVANGSPLGKDYFKVAPFSDTVKAFIYESGGVYRKHDNLSFTLNYSETDFNGDALNLYLYFDYDKTFIESFIWQNTGGGIGFTDNELSAENDLTEISARI